MQNTCSTPPQNLKRRGKNSRQPLKKKYNNLHRPQRVTTRQQPSPRAPNKMATPSNRELVARYRNCKLDRNKKIAIKSKNVQNLFHSMKR